MTKKDLQKELPKEFKCSVSKTGLHIQIWKKCKSREDWNASNELVDKLAKKHHLDCIGAGTELESMTRDWDLLDKKLEKEMVSDAKAIVKSLKAFFKKWNGNSYCDSPAAYDQIEKIRAMVATDEN